MLDKFRETAITWDKASRKVYEPLRASAGDNKGRKLTVQIVNDGVVEDLTGASLSLFWETRDKTNKGLDAFTAVDAKKGEFEIYYTTGMLSNEGTLNANLVLVDTSGRIVSEPFTINVFKGIDDDAIQSSDSFTALTEALAQVGNINNKAERAELLELESTFEQTKVSLEQQLAHNPDDYEGTDREKLQQTVDYILSNKYEGGIIRLSRMYNLTGETPIMIDKVKPPTRKPITFLGASGGIVKRDGGFIFSTNVIDSGDIYLDSMIFESNDGENTIVFDNDKLIRTFINNCHFRFVDKIFYSPTRYIQTAYITGGSIVGGSGSFIEAKRSFDISVSNVMIEHRESFINQLAGTVDDLFTSIRIINILCEGLTGKTFYFRNVDSLLIDGSYFETNALGYIFFDPLALVKNVTISNNRTSHWAPANLPFDSFIHWGGYLENVLSSNNYVLDIKIHNAANVKSGNVLVTTEKINVTDVNNIVRYLDTHRLKEISLAAGKVRQAIYPTMTKSFMNYTSSLGVGKINNVYNLGFKIKTDDIISIQLRNDSGSGTENLKLINYCAVDPTEGKLQVAIENTSETTINFTIFITVLSVGIGLNY